MPDFVIQGGCPEGTGRGGPGYKFADEPVQGEYRSARSRWPTPVPTPTARSSSSASTTARRKLAKSYNLFGYVVDGMDVALGTKVGDVMRKVEIEERDRA